MAGRSRISGADFSWWQMDASNNPMMITGLMWFDTVLDHQDLLDLLRERMVERFPKFSQRVVTDGSGRAFWEDDPHFDVAHHVSRVGLPAPGGKEGLELFVSQTLSSRLDPDRALWHVDLVDGLYDGSAIVVRLHHVIADGISLARVLLQLADASDDGPKKKRKAQVGLAGVARRVRKAVEAGSHWITDPQELASLAKRTWEGAAALTHLATMPADPPSPLRGPLGVRKVAGWMPPIDLDEVKRVGKAHQATVNDVLLAVLGLALRRYLADRDCEVDQLRTFVPFNLRPPNKPIPADLGNQFGLVILELPLHTDDPLEALASMKQRMDAIKRSPEAVVTYGVLQAMAEAPEVGKQAMLDFFGAKASMITTNVPGPRQPLHLAGHEVKGIMCWVPQSADVGVGVSILSYAGTVRMGVAGDANLIPDPHALVSAYEDAFEALRSTL